LHLLLMGLNFVALQVLRPLLPTSKETELSGALISFSKAEKAWQDDPRSGRLTAREKSAFPSRSALLAHTLLSTTSPPWFEF
jgi:hypothetical protein